MNLIDLLGSRASGGGGLTLLRRSLSGNPALQGPRGLLQFAFQGEGTFAASRCWRIEDIVLTGERHPAAGPLLPRVLLAPAALRLLRRRGNTRSRLQRLAPGRALDRRSSARGPAARIFFSGVRPCADLRGRDWQ